MERLKLALQRARIERDRTPSSAAGNGSVLQTFRTLERPRLEETGEPLDGDGPVIPVDFEKVRGRGVVTPVQNDAIAAAYKVLRTNVAQRMRRNGWRRLGITSAREGNGKTLTAINLALSLAREIDRLVILIDLDLRRPALSSYLFDECLAGLSDYLRGQVRREEIVYATTISRFYVVPGNDAVPDSSEQLGGPLIKKMIEGLAEQADDCLVICDLPPVLAGDDVIAFAPLVDSFLLVVEDGVTTKDDLQQAYELLGSDQVIGTVLNKAQSSDVLYGYA